jgi:hypothetical protein
MPADNEPTVPSIENEGEIEVRGYSERGMINALVYEMRYGGDSLGRLREILGLCRFPNSAVQPDLAEIRGAKIRIEQSFSDFGDLDLLILLDGRVKQAFFIEAKVKTYQSRHWRVAAEWRAFTEMLRKSQVPKSNLFVQLYRKLRLAHRACHPDDPPAADGISRRWLVGDNAIVRRAAEELSDYCGNMWFVGLIPDPVSAEADVIACLRSVGRYVHPTLPAWDATRWGYLLWERVEQACRACPERWPETLLNFGYNRGQVYEGPLAVADAPDRPPPPGSAVTWNAAPHGPASAVVVRRGRHNTRIRLTDGREAVVPHGELQW